EHGDLRENSEFKMAKQDQSVLMAQKAQLERDLARARVTDFKDASTDQVGVGTVVEVKNAGSGAATTYTILGAWDGDPDRHIISYKTAIGAALLGKKRGETVKVKTGGAEEDYTIANIVRYVDQSAS
ncbi:MAG TPA: GreA/GreB family elongation factor, partial [Opitutaceae bacterium]|nr:GreA/GreB family elongation factor [Opitutaceae bacterium]